MEDKLWVTFWAIAAITVIFCVSIAGHNYLTIRRLAFQQGY